MKIIEKFIENDGQILSMRFSFDQNTIEKEEAYSSYEGKDNLNGLLSDM